MVYIIIRMEVDDYDNWRKVFDNDVNFRKSGGEKSVQVFRGVKNPNEVVFVREWESLEKWKQFLSVKVAEEKGKKAGVRGEPVIYILEKD